MVPFSDRLREVRNARDKKQREAADTCGVSLRTYQLYEQGKNEPNIAKLIALADFLTSPWIICWGVLTRTQNCDILPRTLFLRGL